MATPGSPALPVSISGFAAKPTSTARPIIIPLQAANAGWQTLLPLLGHFPKLPSKQFAGKSWIGQYGDKLMEGDYHVGQIMDAIKELSVDDNTILVFASGNGPQGETAREMGNGGTPDMGISGSFRGELGEATEGSIRTFCFVRWPGKVKPGTSNA